MEHPDHVVVDGSMLERGQLVLFELQHRYSFIRETKTNTVYEPRSFWFHVWELSHMDEPIPEIPGWTHEECLAEWIRGQPMWQRRWYRRESCAYMATNPQIIAGKRVHLCKLKYIGEGLINPEHQ